MNHRFILFGLKKQQFLFRGFMKRRVISTGWVKLNKWKMFFSHTAGAWVYCRSCDRWGGQLFLLCQPLMTFPPKEFQLHAALYKVQTNLPVFSMHVYSFWFYNKGQACDGRLDMATSCGVWETHLNKMFWYKLKGLGLHGHSHALLSINSNV